MKKAKRILSLVLAVMLVMSVFVLPASAAAPEDEVEPCVQYIRCPKCNRNDATVIDNVERLYSTKYVESCDLIYGAHTHYIYALYIRYDCKSCGTFSVFQRITRESCL